LVGQLKFEKKINDFPIEGGKRRASAKHPDTPDEARITSSVDQTCRLRSEKAVVKIRRSTRSRND
jgi:hypothetical protein